MTPEKLREAFARVYSQAVLADANMREVVGAFESIRERMTGRGTYHDVLSAIDEQIGQTDLTRVVPSLRDLRTSYLQMTLDAEVARLKEAFAKDAREGWEAWLTAYVQNFQENSWRTDINRRLAADALVSAPDPQWPIDRVRRHDWLIFRERWPEAYDWFLYLSEQDVPPEFRARMLAIAAEIQLYRFTQRTRATQLLERAEKLWPGEHVTQRARAELCFEAKDIEGAKRGYQAIVEKKPRLADGFLGQAECADADGDAVATEAFYQQAVRAAPGMTSAHRGLMNWYARRIAERESLILTIFKRVVALTDDEPNECLNLGLLYKKVGRYQSAREWLARAYREQPDNGLAEIWAGHNDRDELNTLPEGPDRDALLASAEAHFQKDLGICPEALDGPWGLQCVASDRKDWASAKRWCDRCLAVHAEWESSMLVRRGQINTELAEWDQAEQDLARALDLEPQNASAVDALLDLADRVAPVDRAKAGEVILRWRQRKGDASEYVYQNRLGNWLYSAGEYEAAEERYRAAIAASPDRAVLRSNYALAATAARTRGDRRVWLDRAIDSLAHAMRLDPSEPEYRDRFSRLAIERDFLIAYGEKALEFLPAVTPIRVDVQPDEVKAILDPEGRELSKETIERINTWRASFLARFGLLLPGLNFSLADGLEGEGKFRVVIMERIENVAATDGQPLLHAVLASVEQFCLANISEFLGHQETANLLRAASVPQADEIIGDPHKLTGLVTTLRITLARQVPITDIAAIARTHLEQHGGKTSAVHATEGVAPLQSAQKG